MYKVSDFCFFIDCVFLNFVFDTHTERDKVDDGEGVEEEWSGNNSNFALPDKVE